MFLFKMLLVVFTIVFAANVNGGLISGHRGTTIGHPLLLQESEPAQYEFQYSVHDSQTGDIKDQFEHRRGDYVTGRYSLIEPDGQRRIVDYSADPLLGFNAEVRRELPVIRSYTIAERRSPLSSQTVEVWPAATQRR